MASVLIFFIRIYQYTLSALVGRCCRFYPTCSYYAVDALRRHGVLRGGWLTVKRICKCHPFNPGGVDLVPPAPTHPSVKPLCGVRPVARR